MVVAHFLRLDNFVEDNLIEDKPVEGKRGEYKACFHFAAMIDIDNDRHWAYGILDNS